jgi:hypothetical protein
MKDMKAFKGIAMSALLVLIGVAVATSASAASVTLTNGGFGQRNNDANSFGFAVCNGSATSFSGRVPVVVTANGITQTVSFTSSLAPSACSYTYLSYATFNMVSGKTYSISVTIDPQHSLVTNTNNRATYASIMVPSLSSGGQVLGASTMSNAERQFLLGELSTAVAALNALLAQIGK